jgi:hypothetical protein
MTATAIAMMTWVASTVVPAGQSQQNLTVYLRDTAGVDPYALTPAKGSARQMFGQIGISVDWHNSGRAVSFSQPPIAIELVMHTPYDFKPDALASAQLYEGSHIFFDQIAMHSTPARVLAHVMVHEITHLLQGIRRHSDSGVMKALWTREDFWEMRCEALAFTPEDVELIQIGLAARNARARALVAGR